MHIDDWNKKYGRLYSLPFVSLIGVHGLGVIIKCSSKIAYHHQAGGLSCIDGRAEGIFMPVNIIGQGHPPPSVHERLEKYFMDVHGCRCDGGMNEDDADFIDNTLQISFPSSLLKVDRSMLEESMEAWVYVELNISEKDKKLTTSIDANKGILVWPNSD